ncbi:MAG: GntR family transcriptional regulator [Clostridiales bacterium]|nr:GntR family transcriptional regulator [Clostridiales bacterium]
MSEKTQTQQVYSFLKDAIYNCRYLPGQEISEKQLFEELPFGRTPIRETLLQLQKEELVEIYPRRGMRIAPFSEELVSNLYQTRKLIEPAIAAAYCPLYSKARLLSYRDGLRAAIVESDSAFYSLDIDFHSYLVSAANNRRLTAIFTDLMWHQYRLAIYAAIQGKTERRDNGEEHERILRALLSEDREEIRASITAHINTSMIALMQAAR